MWRTKRRGPSDSPRPTSGDDRRVSPPLSARTTRVHVHRMAFRAQYRRARPLGACLVAQVHCTQASVAEGNKMARARPGAALISLVSVSRPALLSLAEQLTPPTRTASGVSTPGQTWMSAQGV